MLNRSPKGTITVPPSKSISHRALICAALSGKYNFRASIKNLAQSDDIEATQQCLQNIINNKRTLDCGESGSTLRFLLPIAASLGGKWKFSGHGRLMERPLTVYEKLFPEHGVTIHKENDCITIEGKLQGGLFTLPGNISSQFISGLLMALPLQPSGTEHKISLSSALESASYVDLTIDVMSSYGVQIETKDTVYTVQGGQKYIDTGFTIEADYSQAAYFLSAAALGCNIEVAGLSENSKQGDRKILQILKEMGPELKGITIDASDIPDLIPPLAALASFCKGTTQIVHAERLRLKESDRLASLCAMLGGLGADIKETEDGLIINGRKTIRGGNADSWNDHRIAMAAALASIRCDTPVIVTGYDCVRKSYPDFWKDWLGKGSAEK
ncbi:MAG: 3-phosphoshikimate 1-carboxyvinyltransferase [Spirochaetaceae bacterium]|jgi:3-phosphoshikimate 1-carboxyvinyltransferase|nr:3-phosphoshikimate 1-carboxyvinyltransferase [Spirochaetaceae bacterium]